MHRNRARSIACTEGAPRVLTFTSTRLFVMLVRGVLSRRERAAIPSSVGAWFKECNTCQAIFLTFARQITTSEAHRCAPPEYDPRLWNLSAPVLSTLSVRTCRLCRRFTSSAFYAGESVRNEALPSAHLSTYLIERTRFYAWKSQLVSKPNQTMGNASKQATANNDTDPFGRNENVAKMEITVLSVTFLVAVIGNLCVLLAMRNTKKKSSRMHLFIKHLSLADLVVAFFQVLPQLCWEITFRFYGPDFLCRVVKHLQILGMFASTYMMVMMTLDRYIAICHPLKTLQQPTKRAYIMIGSTWLCSLLLSTPQYFIFSLSEIQNGSSVYDCWGHFIEPWGIRAYITWITVGIFLIPVIILMICYGFICHSIWKNFKSKTNRGTPHSTKNGMIGKASVSSVTIISRAKLRTVKMTLVIVLAYIVCWAPFFIVQMWSVWDENFSWDGKLLQGY